jgi:hypothetical protein
MTDKKIELLEKLIKENKISLKEAIVLIGENEEKIVIQQIPSQSPYTNPLQDPHWKNPYQIYCSSDPFATTPEATASYLKR